LLEAHCRGLALAKRNLRQATGFRGCCSGGDGCRDFVDADNPSGRADELGREERDIAGTAADVEDSHAHRQPGSLEKSARGGLELARLLPETGDFPLRMTEHIGRVLHLCVAAAAAHAAALQA
jgi:hypothetical protein